MGTACASYCDQSRAIATRTRELLSHAGNLAAELAGQGLIALVPATASKRVFREHAREGAPRFLEVWLEADAEECRARDAKGLYAQFARGEVQGLPGGDEVYEPPLSPDVRAFGAQDETALEALLGQISA